MFEVEVVLFVSVSVCCMLNVIQRCDRESSESGKETFRLCQGFHFRRVIQGVALFNQILEFIQFGRELQRLDILQVVVITDELIHPALELQDLEVDVR